MLRTRGAQTHHTPVALPDARGAVWRWWPPGGRALAQGARDRAFNLPLIPGIVAEIGTLPRPVRRPALARRSPRMLLTRRPRRPRPASRRSTSATRRATMRASGRAPRAGLSWTIPSATRKGQQSPEAGLAARSRSSSGLPRCAARASLHRPASALAALWGSGLGVRPSLSYLTHQGARLRACRGAARAGWSPAGTLPGPRTPRACRPTIALLVVLLPHQGHAWSCLAPPSPT